MTTRIPTRTGPARCLCCHTPFADGYIRARTCACRWPLCTCGKCQVHCRCSRVASEHRRNNQKETCHMARNVLHLPYGKERGRYASDRRGITPTLENAWVEPDPTPTGKKELSVCSEMGKRGSLSYLSSELATVNPGNCTDENRESFRGVRKHAFPVVQPRPTVSQADKPWPKSHYLVAYSSPPFAASQGNKVDWRDFMSTNRIHLYNADNQEVGHISESTLSALIDSGLLNRESTPAALLTASTPSTPIQCLHCTSPRTTGLFCADCFERISREEATFAPAWYGPDWDEACSADERMVSA